ncbi:TRAP transporter substrate-binding protein [Microvirga yunnanensis]|uniref:TRAP transporter substrate-binding protein n=1 Tax=Microvirga yunnanensis TaxID=2953740 RepID=UPI0021CA4419|nr:TRAP transporter substrate-binding protein [Microvirga sp. HBU65207]
MAIGTLLSTSLVVGLFLLSPARAADIKDRTIKIGIGLSADHPQGQSVTKFAEIVSQKSGGKIKVRLFAGGALGNDVTMISALQGGTQEMTIPDTSTLVGISGLKEFGLINLPFLIQSGQEADALLDGPFGQKLMAKLPEKGLIGFGFWENGFRQVTNSRRPITKAEDFAGLKLRVIQNPLFIDTFRELGANAVPMPFTEVYTALETKTIDGQENPLATILASKFYEVQKYAVQSNHIYSVWAFLMSKRFWDRLTPDEQALITDAASEAKDFERKTIRAFELTALDELKSKGVEFSTLSEAEVTKLREKTKAVREKFTVEFGQAGAAEMMSDLERIRSTKQ